MITKKEEKGSDEKDDRGIQYVDDCIIYLISIMIGVISTSSSKLHFSYVITNLRTYFIFVCKIDFKFYSLFDYGFL